jgi:hypothetical protein
LIATAGKALTGNGSDEQVLPSEGPPEGRNMKKYNESK